VTFIGNYWWAILAIAGAIVYAWHAVLRASRSANLAAAGGDDTQDTSPALRLYLVVLAAAVVAARQVARGFPLVQARLVIISSPPRSGPSWPFGSRAAALRSSQAPNRARPTACFYAPSWASRLERRWVGASS